MFPDIKSLVLGISSDTSLFQIGNPQFKMRKERLLIIESVLRHVSGNIHDDKSSRRRLIDTIMDSNTPKDLIQAVRDASVDSSSGFITSVVSFVKGTSDIEARLKNIRSSAQNMDDAKFIAHLSEIVNMEPLLADIAVEISQLASTWLYKAIEKKKSALLTKIQYTRETHLKKAFEHEIDATQRSALRTAHERFVIATQDIFLRDGVG
jgi:DNA-binding phage protein